MEQTNFVIIIIHNLNEAIDVRFTSEIPYKIRSENCGNSILCCSLPSLFLSVH